MNRNVILYHATFRSRLPSIKKLGLGAKQIKNWEFSEDNVVCLTTDPECAFSFCESAEDVADSVYESGIIVLAVHYSLLDTRLLNRDTNVNEESPSAYYFTYRGIIKPHNLYVVTRKKVVGQLLALNRVPSYE